MCTLTLVHFVSIPNPYIWILIHVENTSSQGFCYNFACTGQLSNIKQFVLSNFVSSDRQIENDEVIRTPENLKILDPKSCILRVSASVQIF